MLKYVLITTGISITEIITYRICIRKKNTNSIIQKSEVKYVESKSKLNIV